MNPLHVSLRNVRTFEEFDLDLPEGLLAILGSNGAGKSTIINAIDVALFGPESRTLADWYPRGGGDDPMVITLCFEHGGETYRVRRSFSPKGRGQSKTDLERYYGEDGLSALHPDESWTREKWEPLTLEAQTATQERIETLIGITRETFQSLSFLAQNEAGFFCEAAPRQRKAILADVIGLAQWDTWLERARSEKRAAESELDKITGALETAEEELSERSLIEEELTQALKKRQTQEDALKDALDWLAARRAELAQAEKQAERIAAAENALREATLAVDHAMTRLEQREAEIRVIDVRLADREVVAELAGALPNIVAEREAMAALSLKWQERERVERALLAKTAERETAEAQVVQLQRRAVAVVSEVEEENCDRCGQTLHEDAAQRAAASYRSDAAKLQIIAANALVEAAALSSALTELPVAPPTPSRAAELERLYTEAQAANARLAALDEAAERKTVASQEADTMRAELLAREQGLRTARADAAALGPHEPVDLTVMRGQIAEHEQFEVTRREAIAASDRLIAAADTKIARLDKIAADVQQARVRRDELHLEIDLLAAMEKACGPNGVPALILETVAIPQVETEATRILGLLGGPAYACELRTLRETKTGSLSDTLDIVLQTELGEAPYESFSGGERARIAFALRLALAQLLASRKGSATGLLVIDELEGLDAQGIAALVTVLEELQRSVPRIIVVSHVAEMRDSFENTLLLENVDGRSRIVESLPLEVTA